MLVVTSFSRHCYETNKYFNVNSLSTVIKRIHSSHLPVGLFSTVCKSSIAGASVRFRVQLSFLLVLKWRLKEAMPRYFSIFFIEKLQGVFASTKLQN